MRPFREGDTSTTFKNVLDTVLSEIKSLDNAYVLKASEAELEEYYAQKAYIDPLVLHSEKQYIKDQRGTQIDVSQDFNRFNFPGERAVVRGTQIDIAIPYEGDAMLWRIRASTWSLGGYPEIEVNHDEIILNVRFPDDSANAERLKADIERNIKSLEDAVSHLENDVAKHNQSVQGSIASALERKKEQARASTGAVAALGIPVKHTDTPPTFSIPTKRRSRPTKRPSVETGAYEAEPILDEKEYQYILEIMRSMSLVVERNPAAFQTLDEESIRDHFLLQLNGHYEGGATGETFNASGKTDILIREGDKNVFIAECKFWRGQKSFRDAVAQLLGYLTWRDSKCALMVFNRTKDSQGVSRKMHETITSLPEYRKTVHHQESKDSRYIFVKESEPGKEIIITTQLYDIPSSE